MKQSTKQPHTRAGQLRRALNIKQTLGLRSAAKYMYNRGWSIDSALWVLVRSSNVKPLFEVAA